MRIISFKKSGIDHIGSINENDKIFYLDKDVSPMSLGATLKEYGADGLKNLLSTARNEINLSDIDHILPVVPDPGTIFCIGLNYEEHRLEVKRDKTINPTVFIRTASSQIGHMTDIIIPIEEEQGIDFEGEIALIIGKRGRRISAEDADAHIFGYSCYNDASVRSWQNHSTQWTAGKNFPSTGAFGPYLVTSDEISPNENLNLITRLNGIVVQDSSTDLMLFKFRHLIEYISKFSTLEPGDVIVTGTPGGVGIKRTPPLLMQAGDVVEVEVSKLGILRNKIAAEEFSV